MEYIMADNRLNTAYRSSPGISWIVQVHGVQVIDELARRSQILLYPEAVIWELLLRGHTLQNSADMLRWILGTTVAEAHKHIERCAHEWLGTGWIIAMS
jgi:hypothetical protein